MIPDASIFLIAAPILALAFLIDRFVFSPVLGIKRREASGTNRGAAGRVFAPDGVSVGR